MAAWRHDVNFRNLSARQRQGNRISKQFQEFGEEGIIPSGAFEFSAQ